MKLFTYMTAMTLAVGGLSIVGCRDDGRTANQQTNDAAQSATNAASTAANKTGNAIEDGKNAVVAAVTPSGASDVSGMRGAMEGIVQNAFDAGNFKTMTNHFVKADKERLEATAPSELPQLDQAVKAFKDAWQAKYGGDAFGVMDAEAVFNAQFVALQSADMQTGTATIKASHGMPEVKLPFVADAGKWRLDVKDTLDANKLRQNLMNAATDLTAKSASWPADKAEAARVVSHRVFLALTDTMAMPAND
jgi:hypothetical protein